MNGYKRTNNAIISVIVLQAKVFLLGMEKAMMIKAIEKKFHLFFPVALTDLVYISSYPISFDKD